MLWVNVMSLRHKRLAIFVIAAVFLLPSVGEVSGGSATTRMNIQVTATTWLKYRILKENLFVKVTKGDLKNGYKDANSNNVISVSTNNPNGYVISLYCEAGDFFTSVAVKTDSGFSYVLSPGSGVDIYGPHHGLDPDIRQVDFRFYLSPNARAVQYSWPIVLTVHPL